MAIFFTYAFVGWLIEVGFYLYKHKRYVNRGFLTGPLIPIYGFSAVLLHLFGGQL
ncbi:MAG: putative ABC transporter permease, partial [Candidatus Izemoplasmataceae bacterium]